MEKVRTMEHAPELKINYSIDEEVARIKNTLSKLAWFEDNGYKPALPEGISADSSDNEIQTAVEKDYEEHKKTFAKNAEWLTENWPKYSEKLGANLLECGLKPEPQYELLLTFYGVGGSYNRPNKILVNIRNFYEIGLLSTVMHEAVHLAIQDMIVEHNIDHWVKERIVDLLMQRFFPEFSRIQKVKVSTEEIDMVFNELYPNVPEIIEKLARKH
jgi:hypothetical protein